MAKREVTAQEWKEKGNTEFIKGNWTEALIYYTDALKTVEEEKAVYYKNRAAVYLKLCDYENVIEDCNNALKISSNDCKALYRRCQALEALERFEEAYQDAKNVISSDPITIKNVQDILKRCEENLNINIKVYQLMDLIFNMKADKKKRKTAIHDLLIFATKKNGAEEIFNQQGVTKIVQLVKDENDDDIIWTAIIIVGDLCEKNINRTKSIMEVIHLPWFLEMMNSTSLRRVKASNFCLQTILNTYSGMNNDRRDPDEVLCKMHKNEINAILSCLCDNITSKTITGISRDEIISLITNNMCHTALNWAEQFVDLGGLQSLLEVASEIKESKHKSSLKVTSSTRSMIITCLTQVYENISCDAAKEKFNNSINEFITNKLQSTDIELKINVVVAITTLLLSPLNVGAAIVAKEEILDTIFIMATGNLMNQKIVCEYMDAAVTKKEISPIVNKANIILRKLYHSKSDVIRIRALITWCRFSRFEETKMFITPLTNGTATNLIEICKRLLINPKIENDKRKWSIQGLSYLSFDAEVKQKLTYDQQFMKTIMDLVVTLTTDELSIFYNIIVILMNLCNVSIKEEHIPEMIDFAKFANNHTFTNPKMDGIDFVKKRIHLLVNYGMISVLVYLADMENDNVKELIVRIFEVLFKHDEIADRIIQQGFVRMLLPLILNGTDKGKKIALRILVKLITKYPLMMLFLSYAISVEFIPPFMNLLNSESSVSETCETLEALAIILGMDRCSQRYVLEKGEFHKIVSYIYSDQYLLRRASLKVLKCLILEKEAVQYFEQSDDRIKRLTTLVEDNDKDTRNFAAKNFSALILNSRRIYEKFFHLENWLKFLNYSLRSGEELLLSCSLEIIKKKMLSSKSFTENFAKMDIMKLVRSLSKNNFIHTDIKRMAHFNVMITENWEFFKTMAEKAESAEGTDEFEVLHTDMLFITKFKK